MLYTVCPSNHDAAVYALKPDACTGHWSKRVSCGEIMYGGHAPGPGEMVDVRNAFCVVIREKVESGVAALFCRPRPAARRLINEEYDPDGRRDATAFFSRIIPHREEYGIGKATATRTLRRALWDVPVRDCETANRASAHGRVSTAYARRRRPAFPLNLSQWLPRQKDATIDYAPAVLLARGLSDSPAAGIHSGGERHAPVSFAGELPDAARPAFPPCARRSARTDPQHFLMNHPPEKVKARRSAPSL